MLFTAEIVMAAKETILEWNKLLVFIADKVSLLLFPCYLNGLFSSGVGLLVVMLRANDLLTSQGGQLL